MAGVAEQFRGLPMEELIGAPLNAAAKAQYALALTMVKFIEAIGFLGEGDKRTTNNLSFDLERPVDDGTGTIGSQIVHIQAPVLGLVPIPALLIETVNVDFTMEIKQSAQSKETEDKDAKASASAGWGPFKASVSGSVASHRENTRSTDNTAKYNVSVVARQQQPQEGMAKMMDLLSSAVEPISIKPKG